MPGNFRKDDLRIIRTYRTLLDALPKLLQRRNFDKLTVNDICEEAQLSRTAFYSHFRDKYDLLKYWLQSLSPDLKHRPDGYEAAEQRANGFIRRNTRLIKNLMENANTETLDIINDFLFSLLTIPAEKKENGKFSARYTVLSTFCAGGILNSLLWQIKNNFPEDSQMINPYYYSILEEFIKKGDDPA